MQMHHSINLLLKRIECGKVFVLEIGGEVVGSISTQRIASLESIDSINWINEDDIADPEGCILQLLRVSTFAKSAPECSQGIAVGALLRDFCLSKAKSLGLQSVCAVTKTTDYDSLSQENYEDYVHQQSSKTSLHRNRDRGLDFHLSSGATVVKSIFGWRPTDTVNEGYGILISYDLNIKLSVSGYFFPGNIFRANSFHSDLRRNQSRRQ